MHQYIKMLTHVLQNGTDKPDRTGTGTRSWFGYQTRFDLSEGFPLLTTKKLHLRSIIYELLWMLSGSTNVRWLQEHNVKIWDEWANGNGDLGPVYGKQWRSWEAADGRQIDQVKDAIERLKHDPASRRHIVTAWNPGDLDAVALAWCHCFMQFNVRGKKLDCQLYQRSGDIFLGVPFNIASYALLTMMIAQVCDLEPGHFVHTFGDLHLYNNHFEQAKLQLERFPRILPRMHINPVRRDIDDFVFDDFTLEGYVPHPHIAAPVAV